MTDINEIKRELEALTAKVAAHEATKARNWPKRIEAGMVFRGNCANGDIWMACVSTDGPEFPPDVFVCVSGVVMGYRTHQTEKEWVYLGRDILTIRTDAHEPTGAELVGRVCQVSLSPILSSMDDLTDIVTHYDEIKGYTSQGGIRPWKYARLAP